MFNFININASFPGLANLVLSLLKRMGMNLSEGAEERLKAAKVESELAKIQKGEREEKEREAAERKRTRLERRNKSRANRKRRRALVAYIKDPSDLNLAGIDLSDHDARIREIQHQLNSDYDDMHNCPGLEFMIMIEQSVAERKQEIEEVSRLPNALKRDLDWGPIVRLFGESKVGEKAFIVLSMQVEAKREAAISLLSGYREVSPGRRRRLKRANQKRREEDLRDRLQEKWATHSEPQAAGAAAGGG